MNEREKLLEAVAEAAREALTTLRNTRSNIMDAVKTDPRWEDVPELMKPRIDALAAALDALDAQPAQETVTLAVWKSYGGAYDFVEPGSTRDRTDSLSWTRFGTVKLPLDRERGA